MKNFNNLGVWLPPLIEAMDLTVEAFGRKAEISKSQLYKYFNDTSRPSVETMLRICEVLGVPLVVGLRQYTDNPVGYPKGVPRGLK